MRTRGFSMLVVLLALIVMSVVGLATLTVAGGEASVAENRTAHRQALAAAEAGLQHFFANNPASVQPNMHYLGSVGTTDANYLYLPDSKGANGETLKPRYKVYSLGAGPVADSVILVAEGQIQVGTDIVGRSTVRAVVSATAGSGGGLVAQGQKSLGPWGTSSNLPTRTDISLVNLP